MKVSIFTEFKAIFYLALPLIFNLLAYMAMQFVDTLMLGRLGVLPLAAAALGNVVLVITLVGCIGILTAIGALAAQAFGDQDVTKVQIISQQGLWLAFFLSIPAMFLLWNAHHLLLAINLPAKIVFGAREFLHGLFWGFLPALCFIALREFTTAISKPKIVMIIAISAIPFNAVLNYWFMYGGLALPAMRIFGVGLATAAVDWLMFFSLAIYLITHHPVRHYKIFQISRPNLDYLKRILWLGFPVGISFMVEEFLFVITAIMIGYFGVIPLAAHQIAVQCMYAFIMIPIGISHATTVRVSQLLGAKDPLSAFRSAYIGIFSGMGLAFIGSCLFWVIPQVFVGLFINLHTITNQPVVILASKLLIIIAIFHFIDAAQLITNGALRGYQDTLVPMFLGLISFWLVGIGSGYIMGFIFHYGALGLWSGLALGITASAILLQWRLLQHRQILPQK